MAGTLSLLLGGRVRAAVSRCGFATRGVAGPGPVGREPDPDSDWEPEERELQELESTLKRQKKAIRFQKIRRRMEAPGAPPRTLTWESMEQIRYLHKEFAETWSVPRLAEGFDVSTDVIRRVLKSKFVPSLEQKLKQDQKVLERAGLAHAPPRLPAGHSVSGALLVPGEASSKGQSPSTALRAVANTPGAGSPRRQKGRNPGPQGPQEEGLVPEAAAWARQRELAKPPTRDCTGPRRKGSQLSSDKKLEDWKAGGAGAPNFSSRVVQRGREFFDSNGNFLYRI